MKYCQIIFTMVKIYDTICFAVEKKEVSMTKEELERKKLFFELLKRVEKLKENSTGVYKYSNDIFEKATNDSIDD